MTVNLRIRHKKKKLVVTFVVAYSLLHLSIINKLGTKTKASRFVRPLVSFIFLLGTKPLSFLSILFVFVFFYSILYSNTILLSGGAYCLSTRGDTTKIQGNCFACSTLVESSSCFTCSYTAA